LNSDKEEPRLDEEKLRAYCLLEVVEGDGKDRIPWTPWTLFFDLRGLYMSGAVFGVWVGLRDPGGLREQLNGTDGAGAARDELRTLLRYIGLLLQEYGINRPPVAVLEVGAEPGKDGEEAKALRAMREGVRRWGADQDWHHGDFCLYADWKAEVAKRLLDFLEPHPVEWLEPEKPDSATHILTRVLKEDLPERVTELCRGLQNLAAQRKPKKDLLDFLQRRTDDWQHEALTLPRENP
jgi:hypothetical protein